MGVGSRVVLSLRLGGLGMEMRGKIRGKSKSKGKGPRTMVETDGDDDGWTVVTRGMSRVKLHDRHADGSGAPPQIIPSLTAAKLRDEIAAMQMRWRDCAVARQVEELVNDARKSRDVRTAVCVGIGSFARDWTHRYRSLWQLVLFLDVVRWLGRDGEVEVQCVAQDPAFMELDEEVLEELGVKVVRDSVEEYISETAFVFSPFVDWFFLLPVVLKGRSPALYVGNEILDDYTVYAQTEEKREKLRECNACGKEFLEHRDMTKLVDFSEHAHALNGMVIYTRTAKDDDDSPT